jgi:hypothetical protein
MSKRRTRSSSSDAGAIALIVVPSVLSSLGLVSLPGRPVDWAPVPCVGAAVPLEGLVLLGLSRLVGSKRRRQKWVYGLASVVPSLLSGFALPHGLNQALDAKQPVSVKVLVPQAEAAGQVVRVVDDASQDAIRVRIPVATQAGQSIGVTLHRGLFNWRWQPR